MVSARDNEASPTDSNRRRRSLFASLFSVNGQNAADQQPQDADQLPARSRLQAGGQRLVEAAASKDFVIVAPKEARCLEAQIVAEKKATKIEEPPAAGSSGAGQQPASGVMQRLFRRMTGRRSRSGLAGAGDAKGYQDELKQRLELEKARFLRRPVQHQRNSIPAGLLLGRLDGGSGSPAAGESPGSLWHTNENYIPKEEPAERQQQHQQHQQHQQQPQSQPQSRLARRQTSPMIEQFLASHRLRFDSLSSLASSCATTTAYEDDYNDESTSSAASSWSASQLERRNRWLGPNLASLEPDQRLLHWQSLAEAKGSVPGGLLSRSLSSSSSSSGDQQSLELLAHELDDSSPALVCYCSDDTSCSSVELVWARPQLIERRRSYRAQQRMMRNLDSTRVRPVRRRRPSAQPAASPANRSPQPPPPPPLAHNMSRLVSSGASRQQMAVLELAKPSRARDRRVASQEASEYVRQRGRELRRKRQHAAQQQQQQQPRQPGSRNSTATDWVPNPIFGHLTPAVTAAGQPGRERRASCQSLNVDLGQPKVDLSAKINRCKELLRRLGAGELDSKEPIAQDGAAVGQTVAPTDAGQRDDKGPLASKHHRWSLRARPEGQLNSMLQINSKLISGLDRRIKSNVSLLANQLGERISDTGKRAGMLADQLVTSLKETTKEQLVPLATGIQPGDTLPSSFSTAGQTGPSSEPAQHKLLKEHEKISDANNNKAKMFSLIYMHQPQTVITSQPRSSTNSANVVPPVAPVRKINQAKESFLNGEKSKPSAHQKPTGTGRCKTIATGRPGRELDFTGGQLAVGPPEAPQRPDRKVRRPKRTRRHLNVAIEDDSENEPETNDRLNNYYRQKSNCTRKHVTY